MHCDEQYYKALQVRWKTGYDDIARGNLLIDFLQSVFFAIIGIKASKNITVPTCNVL